MAHYVILDENNIVIDGHVGRDETDIVLDTNGNPIDWEIYYGAKRTSYNTLGGIHFQNGEPSPDQTKAFRKNYAGIGYTYDAGRDAFIPPQPFPSWVLHEASCLWEAPISEPNDGNSFGLVNSPAQYNSPTCGYVAPAYNTILQERICLNYLCPNEDVLCAQYASYPFGSAIQRADGNGGVFYVLQYGSDYYCE